MASESSGGDGSKFIFNNLKYMNNVKGILIFLNENLGVITFLVGIIAIYLYMKQKKDRKRSAASLILQEIRYAEQQIRNSDRGRIGYPLSSKLLPTNSWNDNIHLFTKDLKETQIDMISEFYAKAAYIDFLIYERSLQKINQKFTMKFLNNNPTAPATTSNFVSAPTIEFQVDNPILPMEDVHKEKVSIIHEPNPNEQITNKLLAETSIKIEFLYNTPAVEKLRKISIKKWYYLF